ncbi:MAG: hypothetical protein JWR50_2962 [Mucilaginibacter sp.]|nr:hypothetical protein [Mucilaginibacter sp.]
MHELFPAYVVAELICFIIAFICLYGEKEIAWKVLIPFMLIICIAEIGSIPFKAIYRANPIPSNSNAWIFNILMLFQISVFSNMFNHLFKKYISSKPLIITGLAALFLIYVYELFTNKNGLWDYNSETNSVMSVLFICYSLYYYYLLLRDEEYVNLNSSPAFWWVTGTLFFFFGKTIYDQFYDTIKSQFNSNTIDLSFITTILIIILYSCWSYAFICKRWITLNT